MAVPSRMRPRCGPINRRLLDVGHADRREGTAVGTVAG